MTQTMPTVEEIEAAIGRLSPADFNRLRIWFDERAEEAWDRQIEADVAAGRLDKVLGEVEAEIKAGRYTDL